MAFVSGMQIKVKTMLTFLYIFNAPRATDVLYNQKYETWKAKWIRNPPKENDRV